ncbi:MAG: UbiX family flavin prenyltransferase [Armatimonadetes bacterium]|nr:UbiX family flavin prenyltransferase [Armatimonadota bacterium]
MRLVVGISGATGVIYGVRLLEMLRDAGVESHLVMTRHAHLTLRSETEYEYGYVKGLASVVHSPSDLGASISSGSFRTDGMIVAPCSMKSLSGIVNSYNDNLLVRAADVTMKERRRLVLIVRETPLHTGHLRLMTAASELGAIIFPPVPAFYTRPASVDDVVNQTAARVLDLFGIEVKALRRWQGIREGAEGIE